MQYYGENSYLYHYESYKAKNVIINDKEQTNGDQASKETRSSQDDQDCTSRIAPRGWHFTDCTKFFFPTKKKKKKVF